MATEVKPSDTEGQPLLPRAKNASVLSSTISVIKITIGAGILTLPFDFSVLGLGTSIIALCVFGVILLLSSFFIASSSELIQERKEREGIKNYQVSFYDLSREIIPWGYIVVDASFVIIAFGACSSYLIIIGQLLPQMFFVTGSPTLIGWAPSSFFCCTLAACILFPVCFLKKLDSLKFLSAVGFFGVLGITALIMALYFILGQTPLPIVWFAPIHLKSLQVLSIFVFAYCSHVNACAIFNELGKPKNVLRADITFSAAQLCVFVIYALTGVFGYLTFGPLVLPNVLQNYNSGIVALVAQLNTVFIVFSSYPLLMYPCRSSSISLFNGLLKEHAWWDNYKELIAPAVLVPLTYLLAISKAQLDTVFAFVGATAGNISTIVVPSLCYYLLLGREKHYRSDKSGVHFLRGLTLTTSIIGGVLLVVCLTALLVDFF
ncbi:vacuolar amino acid efflux transporter Avt8 [Pelomyxa schiedti]|nr:vacuolar amino acid efflux transporter Avt8 [Pelomyxa schiedti]